MDGAQATANANECFRLVGELLDAAREAVRRGRLGPHGRLLVVASSFYGGYCTLPWRAKPRAEHGDRSIAWLEGAPQDFLRQALEWCTARQAWPGRRASRHSHAGQAHG